MHQSPQKPIGGRRDKHVAAFDAAESDEQRPFHRVASHPKARRFPLREESSRKERDRQPHPRS